MFDNYPPGVTGNEPEIAGYDGCEDCLCTDTSEPWGYSADKNGDLIVPCEHTKSCDCETCECSCHSDSETDYSYYDVDNHDDGYDYDSGW